MSELTEAEKTEVVLTSMMKVIEVMLQTIQQQSTFIKNSHEYLNDEKIKDFSTEAIYRGDQVLQHIEALITPIRKILGNQTILH